MKHSISHGFLAVSSGAFALWYGVLKNTNQKKNRRVNIIAVVFKKGINSLDTFPIPLFIYLKRNLY